MRRSIHLLDLVPAAQPARSAPTLPTGTGSAAKLWRTMTGIDVDLIEPRDPRNRPV